MKNYQKKVKDKITSMRRFIPPSALRAAPPGTGSMKRRIEQVEARAR